MKTVIESVSDIITRPISLLSSISKVFERIVFNDLYNYFVSNDLLNDCNSGFRKHDSTTNRLLALLDSIYRGLEERKDIIMILLDISKAFDKVWHPGLLFKLRQYGVTGNLFSWLQSYLENRRQRVVIGGKSSEYLPLYAGVPQGSILGPLLFLIFINDMPSVTNLECHQYADDTTYLCHVSNPVTAVNQINSQLILLSEWASRWKITFNANKTYFMYITKKARRPLLSPIFLNNHIIQEVYSHVNLGLIITNKLSWTDHIHSIVNKAHKRLNVISRYRLLLPRPVLNTLYLTMVRPVLEYCDVVYDNSPAYLKLVLESVQRKAAIICSGAYRHTETKLLLRDLSWNTLGDRRLIHKLTLFYKIYYQIYPAYLYAILPPKSIPTYNFRNNYEFKIPFYRLNCTSGSFFPSTAKVWNTLSPPVRQAESIVTFKRLICPPLRPNKYYSSCIGKEGNWITRLRLGLSPLNSHRFTYHLIGEPYCPFCVNVPETTDHFLLTCPQYAAARLDFLRSLSDIGVNINNNNDIINVILHGVNFQHSPTTVINLTIIYLKCTGRFK